MLFSFWKSDERKQSYDQFSIGIFPSSYQISVSRDVTVCCTVFLMIRHITCHITCDDVAWGSPYNTLSLSSCSFLALGVLVDVWLFELYNSTKIHWSSTVSAFLLYFYFSLFIYYFSEIIPYFLCLIGLHIYAVLLRTFGHFIYGLFYSESWYSKFSELYLSDSTCKTGVAAI